MLETNTFSYQKLFDYCKEILKKIGCSENDACIASKVLLSADLRGIDSHGVARLSGYVRLYEKQRINTKPHITIEHETPSTATMNGDKGLGLVVAPQAMDLAIKKAKEVGTGWVAVKNSNHFGIAGYYCIQALKNDCIGIAMTNASPLVSPTFGKERMLGTNPMSFAFPTLEEPPFVGDMATTTAANGKLEILQRVNQDAPLGWVQDEQGNATQNASALHKGGALLPLGSYPELASYKGYLLGSVVDIFSAVLSGANYSTWVPPFVAFLEPHPQPVGEGLGHFFGALRIDAFRPALDFKKNMDNWIKRMRQATPISPNQKVLIPGDKEREYERIRMEEGIPLVTKVVEDLQSLGHKLGVEF